VGESFVPLLRRDKSEDVLLCDEPLLLATGKNWVSDGSALKRLQGTHVAAFEAEFCNVARGKVKTVSLQTADVDL
jgi:hypothetical protein